jgi:hypothetical protein
MKSNTTTFAGISLLVLFALAIIGVFEIRRASAQVDASSSIPLTTGTTTAPQVLQASTSTSQSGVDASSTPAVTRPTTETSIADTATTTTSASSTPVAEQLRQGLTEVHIIGTKYTDYFTDGTIVTAYPGDPKIDANLNEPNAPIPSHAGLKWEHTDGTYLYDTPSGDLDQGDYAMQPSGSYIENTPPFVSSTTTPAVSSPTDATSAAPAALVASTSTSNTGSDTFTPPGTWTATNTDSMVPRPPDAPELSSVASTAPATTTGN